MTRNPSQPRLAGVFVIRIGLEAVDHAIAVFGDDGTTAYENSAYKRYFANGEPTFQHDGKGNGEAPDPIRRARGGEAFSERFRITYADGTAVPVHVTAEPYGDNGVSGLVVRIDRAADGAG